MNLLRGKKQIEDVEKKAARKVSIKSSGMVNRRMVRECCDRCSLWKKSLIDHQVSRTWYLTIPKQVDLRIRDTQQER